MTSIATPTQSMSSVDKIMLELRKITVPVKYSDIAEQVGLSEPVTSQALSTSREIGLTKSGGERGKYILTPIGKEYALNLSYGEHEEARNNLRTAIIQNDKWRDILEWLKKQGDLPFDPMDLVREIERKVGKQWSNAMRNKTRQAYTSILSSAELITSKEGKMITSDYLKPEKQKPVSKPQQSTPELKIEEFAKLVTENFEFHVKKDPDVIDFAKAQFNHWIDYVKKSVENEK